MHPALVEGGINTDATQGIEVHFDLVTITHSRIEMRKAAAPPAAAAEHDRCHAVARTEQAGKPRAARMLGQVHQEVIAPRAERAQERALPGELRPRAELAPL